MRALIQRVRHASVTVDGQVVGSCGKGLLILLGVGHDDDESVAVGHGDTEAEAERLWRKIAKMRVFEDAQGKTNLSLADVGGEVLVVSQFTLYANCRRGRRPSFAEAGKPTRANELYERFCELAEKDVRHVGRGVFAADMKVELLNDGPVTLWMDTKDMRR